MNEPSPSIRVRDAARMISRGGHVHCMGIGGVGVAGLARLLAAQGCRVSGCDTSPNRLTRALAADGFPIGIGHDPDHLRPPPDGLIRTAAVRNDHPEVLAALAAGIPVHVRGDALAALVNDAPGVAICGTHGKTTTTAMAVTAFRAAGLDPSFCVGGESDDLGGVAGTGGSPWLVVEADESDGTLAGYEPAIAVVTNIDFDHMERFDTVDAFHAVFEAVVRQTRRTVCYGRDDAAATRIAGAGPDAVGFGFDPAADIRGERRRTDTGGQTFDVIAFGRRAGELHLPLPGIHNGRNALGAVAAAMAAGADAGAAIASLASFRPPRRRLESVFEGGGIRALSDYAHHPAEIRALLDSVREGFRYQRLVAVFQPHRYSRTLALGSEFATCFDGVDRLVLTPVYAASETPVAGGTSMDLMRHFQHRGSPSVELADDLGDAGRKLRATLRSGDLLLIIGAGDVESLAQCLTDEGGKRQPAQHRAV